MCVFSYTKESSSILNKGRIDSMYITTTTNNKRHFFSHYLPYTLCSIHHVPTPEAESLRVHGVRRPRRGVRREFHPPDRTGQDEDAGLGWVDRRDHLGGHEGGGRAGLLQGTALRVREGIELYQRQVGRL